MRGNKEEKYVTPSCHSYLSNVEQSECASQGKMMEEENVL